METKKSETFDGIPEKYKEIKVVKEQMQAGKEYPDDLLLNPIMGVNFSDYDDATKDKLIRELYARILKLEE